MTFADHLRALRAHPHRAEIADALERAAVRAVADRAWRWARELFRLAQRVRR